MRVRNLLAVGSAFLLFAALVFVTVTLSQPSKPPVPVQETGTAAGRPHRVAASADIGRVVDGRFIPETASKGQRLPGPVADADNLARVPGAVPAAVKPKPLELPARGKNTPETASTLKASPAVPKAGYNPKTSRELAPTHADQVVYANADGTKTAFQYKNPVNYKLPDGKWAAISTGLVPASSAGTQVSTDAWFGAPATASSTPSVAASPSPSVSHSPSPSIAPSPAASPSASPSPSPSSASSSATAPAGGWTEKSEAYPESFAASADAPDLVTVPVDGSHSVSFGISNAGPVTGAAAGSAVSYAGVRPDSTVSFSAGTGLVKESIVLSSPSAPTTWVFPLDLKGLRAEMGPGGIVEFADSAGKVLAFVPHGFMADSNINPHSGNGATSYGVTYSLVTVNGHQAIKMALDATWLDSTARVYPVTVDPSVQDVSTDSGFFTFDGNVDTGNELEVGTFDSGSDTAESYLPFTGVNSALTNDTVLGVRLNLFNTWSYSCSARTLGVFPITSSASIPSTGGEVGSKTFATGWVPEGSTSSPCPASWEGIDLGQAGTNLVNGWTHGSPDFGLALKSSDSDSFAWKKFASGTTGSGQPSLAITYTTDGASYSLGERHAITNVTPTSEGTFAIKVKNTGSSTWDSGNANGYEISSTAYSASGGKGKDGTEVSGGQVFTALPSTVAPNGTVTVDAKVAALPAGAYRIVFDMYSGKQSGGTPKSFASQGIQDFEIGLTVPDPPPVVSDVYPPTGFISTTLQQQLSTSATGDGTVTYDFTLTCKPLPGQACVDTTVTSGSISNPYWTPSKADLDWDTPYDWSVVVKSTSGSSSSTTTVGPVALEAEVPQPAITSDLGSSSGQDYDPLSGNYTTSATDAAVQAVGPPLEIDRTYNSLDPRSSGAFGAGWSSVIDTSLRNNGSTVTVTVPNGQQMTFGENGNDTYAAPEGSPDALVESSSGTWTLRDSSGNKYAFTSAGLISSITDAQGNAQDFTYNSSNEVTAITDAVSGRALTLTWSKPSGATYSHVASVTTPAPASGESGYTWTYSYTGDELDEACAPATTGTGCTTYTYGSGSHYWSSVLDANPRVYYQLGDPSGTDAADEVDANLGTADGTYNDVTLGAAGPLAGSSETAASFNGTSSYVTLPNDLITDSTDVSIGLWFKAVSGSSGVLFADSAGTLASGSEGDHATPVLYIGTNGELYGEIYEGSSAAALHSSVAVNNGEWHYAVLSASSSSQALYLDGVQQGSALSGQVNPLDLVHDSVGAGYWGSGWPEAGTAGSIGHFDGDIGQVAVYAQPLSAASIASQYALATTASPELTQVTLPSGTVYEQATYDPDTARLTTYTDPNGGQWQISDPLATGTKASSDALGYVVEDVTVTNPAGQQDTYGYDMTDGGRLISYDNGVDPPEAYGYDAAGFLTTVVDQDGNLVCLTNDIHGNVLTRTWYPVEPATLPGTGPGIAPPDCGGSTASSPTCESGADVGMPCTTFYGYTTYDTANPLDPSNDLLTSVRDGRSSSATDDTYETTYEYNTTGQLILETTPPTSAFPDGRTTRYGYSTGTEAAANNNEETIPAGLLESVTTPGGAVTSYSYDSNGDLAQVTQPSEEYTDYTYDGLGRPLTSTVHASTFPAAGETTSYTYTPTGQQATVTDPPEANAVTGVTHQIQDSYTYNDDNDVLTETQSDLTGGDPSRTTTYTYNDWDQVATVTQPAGATTGGTPQSDGAASSNPDGATTGYDYDALGNVTQVTDPNGNEYRYTYNEYQEPTQETLYTSSANEADSTATCTAPATQDPDGGCDLVLDSDAYDPAGLLASTTDAAGRITNYAYDNDQELIESSTTQACSASGTEPGPCTSMGTCTPTAQCTSGSVGTLTLYNYDGAGNLVSQAVSATHGGAAGTTTTTNYTYDADDMLTAEVQDATPSGASSSGDQNRTTAYTYDADGDVLSKTVGTGDALAETGYTYNTSGAMTSQSVTDPGAGGPVAWYPLTQSSGTSVPDSIAGGRPATSDGTTWTGSAASFPGTSGDISANGPVVDTTGSFSVSAWVNLAGDTSDNQAVMSQSAGTDAGFYLKYNPSTGSWQFTRSQTDSTDPVNSNANDSTAASTGTWTFLTGTYDANTGAMALYVNGTAAGSGTDTTPIASSGPLLIGAGKFDSTLGNFFDGSIADAQVYPYALSSSQVSSLYGLGQGGGDITTGKLTTTWTPDEQGQPTSMTDPDGNVTDYTYDPAGQLVTQTGAPVAASTYAAQTATTTPPVTTYGYDTFGDQTQVEDPDGNVTTTAYDGDGRETSVTQPSYTPPGSSSPITATTSFGYDEDGNLTSVTDPEGNVTSYGYDALGDVTSVTDPLMPGQSSPGTWEYTYDADGERLSATDPLGNKTSETYDYFGNVASSTDAQGNTTRYAYDYLGDQTMADTPDGSVTTSTYDHLGELTSTTDGAGDTTSDAYNDQGNLSQVTNPDGTSVEYGYDQAGRQTSVTDYGSAPAGQAAPELRSESFGYDQDGNQTSATDWDGNTTTSLYNPAGELTGQVKPVSASSAITTSYGYDTAGNRTSVTGGDGNTTWTTYNPWNLPESVVEPTTSAAPSTSDTTYTTAYNADGLPSAVTEPGGVALSYGYDPLGDITSESGSGASASTAARSFTYDSDQRMTSATSGSGTDSFTYNGDGDLTGASGPSGTSSYTYNGDGLVQSETDAAGTTSYTYDAADRLSTETEPLTGGTLTYGYNADSNPVSVSYASGGSTGPEQAFGYNSLQQVTSDTLTSASGSVLASESYGYDADGNVTSQATGGLLTDTSSTYAYDEADQLTSSTSGATTTSYAYDGDGNLTQDGSTTNTYNAQDQLTSAATPAGTTDYSYTLNGELASVTPPSGSATDYAFDAYGDLASAGSVSYGYDALGRMDSRTVGSGSATSLSYLGTGSTLASDGTNDYSYTPSGTVTAVGTPGGKAFTTMTDQHGDVVGTFSPTSTAEGLAGYSSYSPYGAETSTNFGESLGYQGDYTDPVTGLVYMNARWYNPATGSFVSSDTLNGTPIPSTVDGNPYAYADGNPVTDIDPTGHSIWTDVGDDIDVAAHDTLEAGDAAYDGLVSYAEPVGEGLLEGASGVVAGAAVLTTAGFTALFTAASWIFADSTESGCEDVICGQQSYGGGSPAPTWAPEGTPDGGSGGSGPGGSLGNAGYTVSTGSYACAIGCGPISAPQPPPPPPPPPQDCYAGPDPTCTVPPTPGSLLHTPLITSIVKNITSFVELCKQGDCITEHDTSKQGAIKGTTPSGNENPGNPDDADQNDQQLLQPIKNQGVQPAPSAGGASSGSGSSIGKGGGGSLPTASNSCIPEGDDGDYIDLYHGTSAAGAASIRANGIDLTAGRPDPDFGPGFYTTQILEQAEEWAARSANPEILHFQVPASALDDLSGRVFADADEDYSDLVMNGRTEGPAHGYDFVKGPLLINPQDFVAGAPPATIGNQISFHTEAGAQLLMDNLCDD